MTTPAAPATVEDLRAEQAREYGQYVAKTAIYIHGARAFNPGDPVPASHIKNKVVNAAQVDKTPTEKG